jgi:hypothetical protein
LAYCRPGSRPALAVRPRPLARKLPGARSRR